jgi:hypothetical protein
VPAPIAIPAAPAAESPDPGPPGTSSPARAAAPWSVPGAGHVAEQIARRVTDPVVLEAAIAAAADQSQIAHLLPWRPASLAQGHAGVAVLCAAMEAEQPGGGWDRAGHRHLALAAAAASARDPSLFSGMAGIGFAATLLAAGRPRYRRLLARIDDMLEPLVAASVSALDAARGCHVGAFDLISGLTGTGAYLLLRQQAEPPGVPDATLRRLLACLARLLADDVHPRRWHTPSSLASGPLREVFPSGLHNCGLAHGVPGPLALLSLARLAGVDVPRAAEAVATTAGWLAEHRTGTAVAPDWPDGVPLGAGAGRTRTGSYEGTGPGGDDRTPGRAAWCYGAPGVARSLWLAGTAFGDARWRSLAATTIQAVAERTSALWGLTTPTLCHGAAGLVQVLRRFGDDLDDPVVTAAADRLLADLVDGFDPATRLGVRAVEPGGVLVDQPGLLDGAPGVALALLGPVPAPGGGGIPWDRMLLLA